MKIHISTVPIEAFKQFTTADWNRFLSSLEEVEGWFFGKHMSRTHDTTSVRNSLALLNNVWSFKKPKTLFRTLPVPSDLRVKTGNIYTLKVAVNKLSSWSYTEGACYTFMCGMFLETTAETTQIIVQADVGKYAITSLDHVLFCLHNLTAFIENSDTVPPNVLAKIKTRIRRLQDPWLRKTKEVIVDLNLDRMQVKVVRVMKLGEELADV